MDMIRANKMVEFLFIALWDACVRFQSQWHQTAILFVLCDTDLIK